MAKIVNAALKAKAWTFEAKAKAKTIKIGLEAPRGLHHWKHITKSVVKAIFVFTGHQLLLMFLTTKTVML